MFENFFRNVEDMESAPSILTGIRALYRDAKQMQAKLALYQAGTNAAFNAAVDIVFSVAERQELARMLVEVNALVTNWETDHQAALGIDLTTPPLG